MTQHHVNRFKGGWFHIHHDIKVTRILDSYWIQTTLPDGWRTGIFYRYIDGQNSGFCEYLRFLESEEILC